MIIKHIKLGIPEANCNNPAKAERDSLQLIILE